MNEAAEDHSRLLTPTAHHRCTHRTRANHPLGFDEHRPDVALNWRYQGTALSAMRLRAAQNRSAAFPRSLSILQPG